MEKTEPLKAEGKKEEETGSSLFDLVMAQNKDVEEDVVGIQFQSRGEELNDFWRFVNVDCFPTKF